MPDVITHLSRCRAVIEQHAPPEVAAQLCDKMPDICNPVELEDVHDGLRQAMEGLERIQDITRSLGTFSRVEEGPLTAVDLHRALESALNMAMCKLKCKDRVIKNYGQLPPVMASEGKLAQVFLNLLVNAAQAIEDNGFEQNEVGVRTSLEPHWVVLEVSDTGQGIAPEHLDEIFKPFFSTKSIGLGTGLGLHISKNIIENFGGTIEVSSEVGRGSRFVVRLPRRSWDDEEDDALRLRHSRGA
jgi:signal transduction histidine kinase